MICHSHDRGSPAILSARRAAIAIYRSYSFGGLPEKSAITACVLKIEYLKNRVVCGLILSL